MKTETDRYTKAYRDLVKDAWVGGILFGLGVGIGIGIIGTLVWQIV